MASEWFFKKNEQTYGPYSATQLRQVAQKGELSPTDSVWRDGMEQPVAASRIKGLFNADLVVKDNVSVDGPTAPAPREKGMYNSAKTIATVAAHQAELARLKNISLPSAYHKLGKAIYDADIERSELSSEFSGLDQVRTRIQNISSTSKGTVSPQGLGERAKAIAKATTDVANSKLLQIQLDRGLTSLGKAAYERHSQLRLPKTQVDAISSLQEQIDVLTNAIKDLAAESPSRSFIPLLHVLLIPFCGIGLFLIFRSPVWSRKAKLIWASSLAGLVLMGVVVNRVERSAMKVALSVSEKDRSDGNRRIPTAPNLNAVPQATDRFTREDQELGALQRPQKMKVIGLPTKVLTSGKGQGEITCIEFSPSGKYLYYCSDQDGAHLWNTSSWTEIILNPEQKPGRGYSRASRIAFSSDETRLASLEDGSLTIRNLVTTPVTIANVSRVDDFNSDRYWYDVLWSPTRMNFISRGTQGGIQFWTQGGGTAELMGISVSGAGAFSRLRQPDNSYWITNVVSSPDGELIAMTSMRGVRIWSVSKAEELKVIHPPESKDNWTTLPNCGFSPDGKTIATTHHQAGDEITVVQLWDAVTFNKGVTLNANESDLHVSFEGFSPDAKLIVTSSGDGTWNNAISVWDATSGKLLQRFKTMSIRHVMFLNGSKTVCTGGHLYLLTNRDYTVNFWNVETGELDVRVSDRSIGTIAVSPDGRLLATGNAFNEVKLWDLNLAQSVPYEDEYLSHDIEMKASAAEHERLNALAKPITLAQFSEVKKGMNYTEVKSLLEGSGKLSTHVERLPRPSGGLGYDTCTRYTVRYPGHGQAGAYAVFIFERIDGERAQAQGLVSKFQSGLR